MKNTVRRIGVMMICIIYAFVLAGCSTTSSVSPNSEEKGEVKQEDVKNDTVKQEESKNGLNPVGEFPISKEKQEVTILLEPNTYVEDYDTNRLTQIIEEKANVNLNFVYLPNVDAADKLAVMINSGEKLPDIINFGISMSEVSKYANAGAFIALDEYIDSASVNLKKYNEMYPEYNILKNITSPDGHIYTIPSYADNHVSNEVRFKYWINKSWLDALNLSMPATTEEFYNVLKAFKEQDPNGNGKNDEIPLIGSTGWSADVNKFLINAYGFCNQGDMWVLNNGKVDVSYAQDYYKDALEYISKLTDEGLLDKTSYTMELTAMQSLINNEGTSLVGCFAYTSNDLISEVDRYTDYVALSPLEGPSGYKNASVVVANPKPYWFVTSDCANPELAFRIGDLLFDEEMYYDERYGEENVNWKYVDDSITGAYEELGIKSKAEIIDNIWTVNQNKHWRCQQPCLAITAQYSDIYYTPEQCAETPEYARANILWDGICDYYKNKADSSTYIGNLSFTLEEEETIQDIRANLKTFVGEQTTLFSTGARSLDEWDSYLHELEDIGLSTFLDICQRAYDRTYEK